MTAGTPDYLSPEALEAPDEVTVQADIYAIGAVAYYLVSGRQVFTGATTLDVCVKHVRAIPEPPRCGGAVRRHRAGLGAAGRGPCRPGR